jgi:hypothetical protein
LKVSKDRGEQLAIEYGIKFMETSAKASINVEEAFFTLARDIKAKTEKKLVRFLVFYSSPFWFNSAHNYKLLFHLILIYGCHFPPFFLPVCAEGK